MAHIPEPPPREPHLSEFEDSSAKDCEEVSKRPLRPGQLAAPPYCLGVRLLLTLFVIVPFVELVLLIALGQWMGFWNTVLLILVTGITGAVFAKREGFRALREVQSAIGKGQAPEQALLSGLLLLVGGAFLITPGLLTDLTGLLCLVPATRHWMAGKLLARMSKHVTLAGAAPFSRSPGWTTRPSTGRPRVQWPSSSSRSAGKHRSPGPVIIEAEGEEVFRSGS